MTENGNTGPTSVATMFNQIYLPITSGLGDKRHFSRKKLGDF